MRAFLRLLPPLMVVILLLVLACGAQAAVATTLPKLMARCTTLYFLWFRYEQHPTYHHTGQRARAELALYGCENGEYEDGIQVLERMLRRGRFTIPPT
jgi:hypothetical protein